MTRSIIESHKQRARTLRVAVADTTTATLRIQRAKAGKCFTSDVLSFSYVYPVNFNLMVFRGLTHTYTRALVLSVHAPPSAL